MSLPDALDRLRHLRLDASGAVGELNAYLLLRAKVGVFATLYPREFRRRSDLLARGPRGTRRLEVDLLRRLAKMLPIDECVLEELDEGAEECDDIGPINQIPVRPWFPHYNENLDRDVMHLPAAERLAALLSWEADLCWIADGFGLTEEIGPIGRPSWDAVCAVFRRQRTPVRYFLDALAVVTRQTACGIWDGFCTCGGACGCGLPWDAGVIRAVAAQKRRAIAIGKNLERCSRWLEAAGPDGARTILRLWSEAAS